MSFRVISIDDERTLRTKLLERSAFVLAALCVGGLLTRELNAPMPRVSFWLNAAVVPLLCLIPLLLRWGAFQTASAIIPALSVIVPAALACDQAGLGTPAVFALPLAPLTGMFFGGPRIGIFASLGALAAIAGLAALHLCGFPFPHPRLDPMVFARSGSVTLATVVAMGAAVTYYYETQRRQREGELQESQFRYALAAEGSLDGLYENDLVSGRCHYSARFKALLGYDADAVLEGPLAELLHPLDRDAFRAELAQNPPHFDRDVRLCCAKGEMRWFQLRGAVRRLREDQVRLAGSIRDISARKLADQLKEEFVATVSHELRTPLTSMGGALRLLQHGVAGPLPEAARELLDVACRNTDRLRALVEDLLDVQRLTSGHLRLEPQAVDLAPLLRESIALNQGYADAYGVRLALYAEELPPTLEADPKRLQQVVTNLLSNACKYAPRGSAVELRARAAEGLITVSVTDAGPGVPGEFEPLLFAKFAQAESGTARQHAGAGLGLSICQGIVHAHGGHIGYRRAGDKTVFEFSLWCDGRGLREARASDASAHIGS